MQTLKDWPLNEAFSFLIPPSLLTMSKERIKQTLLKVYLEWRLLNSPFQFFPWRALVATIEWRWHDAFRIPLPRRLSNKLYEYGYKLPAKFWGNLGNELKENVSLSHKYILRLTNNFNWTTGAYGDSGSCMWDGRHGTRKAMADSGKFLALQVFGSDPAENRSGKYETVRVEERVYYSHSRCWVYPTVVEINGKEQYVVLTFNSYGPLPLATLAIIISGLTGATHTKRISVSNNGRTGGGIYVNSGGGMLIGNEEAVNLINHMDMSFRNTYDGSNRIPSLLQMHRMVPFHHRRHQGAVLRSTTGAVIGTKTPESSVQKKRKAHSSYSRQKQLRETYRKDILFNRKMNHIEPNYRQLHYLWFAAKGSLSIPEKVSDKTFIRKCLRLQYDYRGSNRNEQAMFDHNQAALKNIAAWTPRLETEFPRWTGRKRRQFVANMVKGAYNVWPYITLNFNLLIKRKEV